MFSEVAEIALVTARLGQFQQLPKTRVILILNFTRPHAITYTNLSLCFAVLIGLRQVKRIFEKLHTLAMLSMLSIT